MTDPVLTLTPEERQIIDFMRAYGTVALPDFVLVGGLPNGLKPDDIDLKMTGIGSPAFSLAAGLGLLAHYREQVRPDCDCLLCQAVDDTFAVVGDDGACSYRIGDGDH